MVPHPKSTHHRADEEGQPSRPTPTNRFEEDQQAIARRLGTVKRRILVLSGKGGVGKSTVAVNLAYLLAEEGQRVGLFDVDFHGPSVPLLLHLETGPTPLPDGSIMPVRVNSRLSVISLGLMLPHQDDAVIWRGPLKMNVIRQFLRDVVWGELDFLVFDLPPGTGDEPLSIVQLLSRSGEALIVTTPQELALIDVRKCINFCRKLELPIIGVVENQSGFVCPHCGRSTDIYKRGGAEEMARRMEVRFLGRIPIDPAVVEASDAGRPFVIALPASPAAQAFRRIARSILSEPA